jgi:hypothetical protein
VNGRNVINASRAATLREIVARRTAAMDFTISR